MATHVYNNSSSWRLCAAPCDVQANDNTVLVIIKVKKRPLNVELYTKMMNKMKNTQFNKYKYKN